MSAFPKKLVVDTNVPKTANLAVNPEEISEELIPCVLSCIEAVENVVQKGGLVMDSKNEIFDEYRRQLSLSGQPGVGDRFLKWVHDNRWSLPAEDLVEITPKNGSYEEFPDHEGLEAFDKSDRKFIAVANAHPKKPTVFQATDSKWWGWKEALAEVGIIVRFLCSDYIEKKFEEKMGE